MKRWGISAGLALTGGDPLLREDLFDILKYIQGKQDIFFEVLMMGNPFHLSLEVAGELKKHGVLHYQISIDGMEETHDRLRRKGSFQASLEGLRILRKAGLGTGVMFTLSNLNKDELLDVMRLADEENVDRFAFDRVVPVGAGENLKDDLVDNRELKELMGKYMQEKLKTNFKNKNGFKSNLFKIFLHEQDLLHIPEGKSTYTEGCLIGKSVCILSDGRVLPCRRLPIDIGKMPEQTFTDVFINSPLLNKFRDIGNFKKCNHCKLGPVCRGCPAVAYGVTGDPFAPDPNCWRMPGNDFNV
jgi:radical SAM protein with 4Fe4S-binding SPASM domain